MALPRDPRSDLPLAAGDIPPVLYHVTPASNLAAILEGGLEPRSRCLNEDHPPRVYLTPSPARALSLCWQIRWAMVAKGVVKRNWAEDFAILAVRTDLADVGLRWDGSSTKEGGVYAEAAIPAEAVRHVETVDGRALLSGNSKRTWDHVVWNRPRPDCLVLLGAISGLPGWTGWRKGPGAPEETLDLDALWPDAGPRP